VNAWRDGADRTSATRSEIISSTASFAVRYSQNRSGVEMTAPKVRSGFSKNTVPAMKKNPIMEDVAQQDVGLGRTGRRSCDIDSSTASQMSPEKTGRAGTSA